jgi:hypothetical protein
MRHRPQAAVPERSGIDGRRGPSGPVQRDLLAGRRVPDQPEGIPADPAALRHDDCKDRVRGNRRIDGGPTGPQDSEAGRRREVVRRDYRPAGTARERDRHPGPIVRHATSPSNTALVPGPPT